MKTIKLIGFLVLLSFYSFSQTNYTFCYGSIAVTLLDGGNAEMVRYNSSGSIVSRVNGTFDLSGKGSPTETLKINFQGTEYRYDLIRDGFGKPAKIFDNQMREYNLCKSSKSSTSDYVDDTELKKNQEKRLSEGKKSYSKNQENQIKELYLNYKKGMKPEYVINALRNLEMNTLFLGSVDLFSISGKASYNELKKFRDKTEQTKLSKEAIAAIVGNPITIEDLLVAQNDLPKTMNWNSAKKACVDLGAGWRLPTKDELKLMYLQKNKIRGFFSDSYWSSSVYEYDSELRWGHDIGIGNQFFGHVEHINHVRAVRDLNIYDPAELSPTKIIGNPIIIGNLQVAQIDFPYAMNWNNAKKACADLGNGWHLPTRDEITILYENREKIGGLNLLTAYWSSSEYNGGSAWYKHFGKGDKSGFIIKSISSISVRAVRVF
jgi:hypothetical protein